MYNYETAFFLFTLGIFGNFVGETVGCQLQKAFAHTMTHKYLVIFAMIYFTLNFTSKTIESPFKHLKRSLLFFMFYILLNRMSYSFSMIVLSLFALLYVLQHQIEYIKSQHEKANVEKSQTVHTLEEIHKYIDYLILITICIGFLLYFKKQKLEHKDFTLSIFLFGKPKCMNV